MRGRDGRSILMRILAPNSTALARETQNAKRAGSGTFQLDTADTAKPQVPVPTLRTVGGIDALVALQGYEDPAERRRRAVGRGKSALDVLDQIKLGLLGRDARPVEPEPVAGGGRAAQRPLRRAGARRGARRNRAAGGGRTRQNEPARGAFLGAAASFRIAS